MDKAVMLHAIDLLTLELQSIKDYPELRTYIPDGHQFSHETDVP